MVENEGGKTMHINRILFFLFLPLRNNYPPCHQKSAEYENLFADRDHIFYLILITRISKFLFDKLAKIGLSSWFMATVRFPKWPIIKKKKREKWLRTELGPYWRSRYKRSSRGEEDAERDVTHLFFLKLQYFKRLIKRK